VSEAVTAPGKRKATRVRTRLAALLATAFVMFTQGVLHVPAHAQPATDAPARLRLDVDQMNPRVITSTSRTLTISGKITNTGDRRITGVTTRLQLGERQAGERQLSDAMTEPPATDSAMTRFTPVVDVLEPGQTAPLALTVPIGDGTGGLQVGKPGVYPLLVNINGRPEYGGAARLAALSMLVPVVGVPGAPPPPRPERPTGVSVLWPIADTRPHVVAAPYGGPVQLADDQLADDLNPGGRLDSLVSAAGSARSNQSVFGSLCFALEPDLLETVDAMTHGYQVRTPDGPVDGRGAEAAKRWLASLRDLVRGHCVVAMPFADADLAAVSKIRAGGGDTTLVRAAVSGEATIERLLGVQPLPGVLWSDGAMDDRTLAALPGAGIRSLITDPTRLSTSSTDTGAVTLNDADLRAQPVDPLLSAALGGTSGRPESAGGFTTPADEPDVAVQNGLAALAFRVGADGGAQAGTQQRSGGQLLLAPPRRWTAPADELNTLLGTLSDFTGRGLVSSVSLQQLLATPAHGRAAMNFAGQDLSSQLPTEVTDRLGSIDRETTGLNGAMALDPTAQVDPAALIRPLRNAMLRATSTAWRPNSTAALAAADTARAQLDALAGRVTVATPSQPISLASGSSPLPVFISSTLPVAVTVRIVLTNSAGLRPDAIPDQTIPANSAFNRYIPAEALRAGRFSVDVTLTTPEGTQLGQTARFELTSNEYGAITLILTLTAAAALLLLSGRQIYRRVKERRTAGV
jgi:hypothetical protein